MKKLLFGLLLGSLITQSGCLGAKESLAVRCDGGKNSNVGYGQKIFYFSKEIKNLTYKNVISYIQKKDNKDCHEFYVMSKTKKGQGGGYKMEENISLNQYQGKGADDAPVSTDLYFAWDGSEDLSKAAKSDKDISSYTFKDDDLITPKKYKNTENGSNPTENSNNTTENGSNTTKIFLISVVIISIGASLYYYFAGETKQTKKEAI